MAKAKASSLPPNPLVSTDYRGTLQNCAAVIEHINDAQDDENTEPTDSYRFGRWLVLRGVIQAMRHEATRSDRLPEAG